MRAWTGLLAVLAAVLVAAPPAAAQAPIALGAGENASLIVDSAGTGHVAFRTPGGYTYCRLPRKARACDVRSFLPLAGAQNPFIFERGDGVLILVAGVDNSGEGFRGTTYLRTSADRGVTWSAPLAIAVNNWSFSAVALAPGEQSVFTVAHGTSVVDFQHAPFAGGEGRDLNLLFGDNSPNSADMAVLRDGRIMVIFGDQERVRWRAFGGGDFYTPASWGAQGVVEGIFDPELVSGPRGTYIFEHRPLAEQRTGNFAAPFAFRSLDTRRLRWRAPRSAAADRSIFGSSTAIQDARGRLHVIGDTVGAGLTTCVLYTRTGTRRNSWFGKTTVLFRTINNDRTPQFSRVGANRAGRGFAVWADKGGEMWATPLRQARGKYRPRSFQGDRPACVGTEYS